MPQMVTDSLDPSTLLKTLIAFKNGDFSVRLPVDETGIAGKIADTLNDIFQLNERMASEFARISSAVGKEGKINQRASMGSASGDWAECLDSVNGLIGDLVQPSTEVARVMTCLTVTHRSADDMRLLDRKCERFGDLPDRGLIDQQRIFPWLPDVSCVSARLCARLRSIPAHGAIRAPGPI